MTHKKKSEAWAGVSITKKCKKKKIVVAWPGVSITKVFVLLQ
jgi:hypothetical protein